MDYIQMSNHVSDLPPPELAECLDGLRAVSGLLADRPSPEVPIPVEFVEACAGLEAILRDPCAALLTVEDLTIWPGGQSLSRLQMEQIVQDEDGLAGPLWSGEVKLEQVLATFSRPASLRRFAIAWQQGRHPVPPGRPPALVVRGGDISPPHRPTGQPGRVRLPLALAFALLSVGAFALGSGWSGPRAAELQSVKETLAATEQRLDGVLKELKGHLDRARGKPAAADPYSEALERALEVAVRVEKGHPHRLVLQFSDAIRLPYFSTLKVQWSDRADPETVYFWRDTPLNPLQKYDYDPPPPGTPPQVANVTLLFYPTLEAREKSNLPEVIRKVVPVILTERGIQLTSGPVDQRLKATLIDPPAGAEVLPRFRLTLSVQAPALKGRPDRVLHILVRAPELPGWRDRYFVLPVRIRPSDLPGSADQPVATSIDVSLLGMLDGVRIERPVGLELLVVELPWVLQGWEIPRRVLPLDDPALQTVIKDRRSVRLKPGKE